MRGCKARQPRHQKPLNEAFSGANDEFDRLPGTSAAKLSERPQCVTNYFVKPLASVGKLGRPATAFEQFNPEIAFQFFQLPTELALSIGVVTCRRGDTARSHNLAERLQTLQRETGLGEKVFEHDWAVIMDVFSAINKSGAARYSRDTDSCLRCGGSVEIGP